MIVLKHHPHSISGWGLPIAITVILTPHSNAFTHSSRRLTQPFYCQHNSTSIWINTCLNWLKIKPLQVYANTIKLAVCSLFVFPLACTMTVSHALHFLDTHSCCTTAVQLRGIPLLSWVQENFTAWKSVFTVLRDLLFVTKRSRNSFLSSNFRISYKYSQMKSDMT